MAEDEAALITDFTTLCSKSSLSEMTGVANGFVDLNKLFNNSFGAAIIKFYSLKNDAETYTPVANDTFGFHLFGYRSSQESPCEVLCQSSSATSCILGSMKVATDPATGVAVTAGGLWADTLAITSYWIRTCAIYDSAANRAASLHVPDLCGIRHLMLKIVQTDGSTINEANNIGAVITVY